MTAQMLKIGQSVYVALGSEAAHPRNTAGDGQTERIKRPMQLTSAEKLLLRLLVELCTFCGAGRASTDSPADLAANLGQFAPLLRKLTEGNPAPVLVTQELKAFFDAAHSILSTCRLELGHALSDAQRQLLVDMLGQTASAYWWSCERQGLSGLFAQVPAEQILDLLILAEQYASHSSIRYPRRSRGPRYDDTSAARMVGVPVALR